MSMRNVFLSAGVATVLLLTVSVVEAQRGGGGRGGGGAFGGFGGGRGGSLQLLGRDDVQKELGLTSSQIGDFEELQQESRGGRGGFENFREMSEDERNAAFARMREQRAEQQKELRGKIGKILNSDQRSRFAELEFQYQLQRGSAQAALEAAGVDLSEDDQSKLSEAQEEVQARMREQIADLQQKGQMEILTTVVSESQIARMKGEEFAFSTEQPRGRFGQGGRAGRANAGGGEARARRRPTQEGQPAAPESTGRRSRRR